MIITISGLPGAGKSLLAKKLAESLGWPLYSMGNLRRQAAADQGLTLAAYNQLGETDPATDLAVDRLQENLGKTQDKLVVEGRTSWHFIPHSVKIFLSVDPRIGAERIWQHLQQPDNRRNEDRSLTGIDDVLASNAERLASDRRRYAKYFQLDVYDQSHYDLVLDTSQLTPDQVLAAVREFIAKRA